MNKPDIEAIRQSPRQYVDLETVEALSDYAMILDQQLVLLRDVIEQLLDDMGEEGHCVCDAAKIWAIEALAGTDLRDQQGLDAAQDLLGHRSQAMTEHYTSGAGKIRRKTPTRST
jgi:integrase